jgi:peptide/nickel transport system substrate-binding protein
MTDQDNYWTRAAAKRLSRRRMMAVASSGALAAYLAACGGDDSSPGATKASGTNAPGTAPAVNSPVAGKFGGKLKVAVTLEPGTLDPHLPVSGGDTVFLSTMYNSLVALEKLTPDQSQSLAEKWEIADPTTINFTLRKGITFHDGTPFNAAAVKYNMERILNPANKATWATQLASIDRVETPDENTARFILKQPDSSLLFALSGIYGNGIVSPTAVEKWGKDFRSHPVGTGPFVLDQWIPGTGVTVKRNPNYWEKAPGGAKSLPYVDEVTISAIPDSTVRYANLQTGDSDMGGIDSKDIAGAKKNGDLNVVSGLPGAGCPSVLTFNLDKAPMDNLNLRKAMAFALDPTVVAKNVYFDLAVPADGGLRQPGSWSYSPVAGRPTYDVAKAKQFLADGGQPNGFSVDVITYSAPSITQQTEIYQEQWSKIGIKAQITTQDVSTSTNSFFTSGLFPAFSTSWGGTSVEPSTPTGIIYLKNSFYNPMKRAIDPKLDDLAAKAKQTYDLQERKSLYEQIDKIVLVDQTYFMPMLYSQAYGIYRKSVGNTDSYVYHGFNRLQVVYLNS